MLCSDTQASCAYQLIPIRFAEQVIEDDDLTDILLKSASRRATPIQRGDILVIAASVVSKAEGRSVPLVGVAPSMKAKTIGTRLGIDPRKVEVALDDAVRIVRSDKVLITKRSDGLITDMSGIDESNAPTGYVLQLPGNPDASAASIHHDIKKLTGLHIPIIISDTQGRPWRLGAVGVAIGVVGMSPFMPHAGKTDLFGNVLRGSLECLADELAAASGLAMGQGGEGVPAVIVRGVDYSLVESETVGIARIDTENLFL